MVLDSHLLMIYQVQNLCNINMMMNSVSILFPLFAMTLSYIGISLPLLWRTCLFPSSGGSDWVARQRGIHGFEWWMYGE